MNEDVLASEMDLFPNLSSQEIDAIFDAYIEREVDDVPADIFFAMLAREPEDQPVHDVEIESGLVGETLVLQPPADVSLPFTVNGNEIILGEYRIRLRWTGVQGEAEPSSPEIH